MFEPLPGEGRLKDLAVPQLQYRAQLWFGFNPWPGNFHMLQVQPNNVNKQISHIINSFCKCELYFIHLKKITFWEGAHRFPQTTKGFRTHKK